jgi:hypothetical protein
MIGIVVGLFGFLLMATLIGQDMGLISAANAAAVVAAGLVSVICFPHGAPTISAARRCNEPAATETVAV